MSTWPCKNAGAAAALWLLLLVAAQESRGEGISLASGIPRVLPPVGGNKPKPSADPVAITVDGAVQGVYQRSRLGRQFAAFRGIPYAEAPVGERRFKPAEPKRSWLGVLNATQYGSACMQYGIVVRPDQERITGAEDCLFVNVFTPQLPSPTNLPHLDVIIYIHGGSFMYGSADIYGPRFLMDENVVFVTINYRLGLLGFLSTEDEVLPGNNGLKDQALALRWIKRNIAAFGGNPYSITLTGQSAGGSSAHFHYFSPYSQGLFHRGMSFSGTALSPWTLAYDHRNKAFRLGELVGCSSRSSAQLVRCLKSRPARQLLEQTARYQTWRYTPDNPFGPIAPEPGSSPFLPKRPVRSIIDGDAQDLPWVTSVTSEEGIAHIADFILQSNVVQELDQYFDEIIPNMLYYNYTVPSELKDYVSSQIRLQYFQRNRVSYETLEQLVQMFDDGTYNVDGERASRLMALVNKNPVYFFEFGYKGAHSITEYLSQSNLNIGAAHEDDVAYFTNHNLVNTETTEADRSVIGLMTNILANFAKSGNPTPSNKNVQWFPVQGNNTNFYYLKIHNSNQLESKTTPDLGNKVFWDSLPINKS